MVPFTARSNPTSNDLIALIEVLRQELVLQSAENGGYCGMDIDNVILFDGQIDLNKIAKAILKSSAFVN